jgi:hypothetical protein
MSYDNRVGRRNFLKGFGATVGFLSLGSIPLLAKDDKDQLDLGEKLLPELVEAGHDLKIDLPAEIPEEVVAEAAAKCLAAAEERIVGSGYKTPDAFHTEFWASEAAACLNEHSVFWNWSSHHGDKYVSQPGDVVNVPLPKKFVVEKIQDGDTILDMTNSAFDFLQIPLNDHLYSSTIIKDGEASMNIQDIMRIHLVPGMMSLAQMLDLCAHEQLLKAGTPVTDIFEANAVLNKNQMPLSARRGVISPTTFTDYVRKWGPEIANTENTQGVNRGNLYGFDTMVHSKVRDDVYYAENGLIMLSRPLALPHEGMGIRSSVAEFNGLYVRASMMYDINSCGTKVVLETLTGSAATPGAVCKVVNASEG